MRRGDTDIVKQFSMKSLSADYADYGEQPLS
jgi:hypothetical protein